MSQRKPPKKSTHKPPPRQAGRGAKKMPDYDEQQQEQEQQPAPVPEPKNPKPPRALSPNEKIALVQAGVPIEAVEPPAPPEEKSEPEPED